MYSITSQEHAALMVEVLADSLADLVCCPPVAVLVRQLVRCDNLLRRRNNGLRRDLRPVCSTTGVRFDLRKLDVKAGYLVFAWNDHHRSRRRAVYGATFANIREVGDRDDVQYAPDMICGLSFELKAQLFSRPAVSAVAAYNIFRLDGLCAALLLLTVCDEFFRVIVCQIASEQTIVDSRSFALSWFGLVFSEISQLDCNGIVG
jgi:hypothetical protein